MTTGIKSGQLRHELTYQELVSTGTDTRGQPIDSWSDIVTLRASITTLSGRELERARELVGETTHQIETRYHSSVDSKGRFEFGSRYFNILWLNNVDERDLKLIALCKEGS